jgi:hypothetical protein
VENFDLTPRALTRRIGFEGEFSFCVALVRRKQSQRFLATAACSQEAAEGFF